MPYEFDITEVESGGGPVIVRVSGHLDAKSTPGLVKQCLKFRTSGQHVILNLSGVSFIASSGVGGILAMLEDFTSAGLVIRLAAPSSSVHSVIKLLNLDRFLPIAKTEAEAVSSLKAA